MPKLLLIDNHDSFTYNLVELLRQLNITPDVQPTHNIDLDKVDSYSHILLSPGADLPACYPNNFAVLQRYYPHKSILGVCLGLQTLAQFFGATLYNLADVRHGQRAVLTHDDEFALFKNLPSSFGVGLYHSWAVSQELPCELIAHAHDETGVVMAMQHCSLPIYGVQFHPESYISEYGQAILSNWLGVRA
ncbi:MAG: anthranilate synthase component II [Moraxella sp.]|nr:anthranilate synthase component II [Moraxella sp.]